MDAFKTGFGLNTMLATVGSTTTASDISNIKMNIIDVLKGEPMDDTQKQRVDEFFGKEDICTPLEVFRKDISLLPIKKGIQSAPDKLVIHLTFSPLHLAIMFGNKIIIDIIKKRMTKSEDFTKEVLNTAVQNDDLLEKAHSCNIQEAFDLPDEAFNITGLFLAVKYSELALKELMQPFLEHDIMDELFKAKDFRELNLLQFSTFNKTPDCIK